MATRQIEGQMSKECSALYQAFMDMVSDEACLAFEHLEAEDSDVIIAAFMKTGSTWLQQIVHQLRTGGDMEFDDILQVFPSIEVAYEMGLDLNQKQMAHPRCFKSHYSRYPKTGKYLVIFRNPYSVAFSLFRFLEGWLFQPGTVTLDEFMDVIWLQPAGSSQPLLQIYCDRIVSWWQHRHSSNVHVMFYEDLLEEFESGVRAIADFMGIQEEEKIQAALEMSTFKFMKEHWYKFSSHVIKQERNQVMGLSQEAGIGHHSKIRTGSTTEGQAALSTELLHVFDKIWKEVVFPATGYASYEEICQGWKDEKQKI